MKQQTYQMQHLNPTNSAASWSRINPVLLNGEIAFEADTGLFKIGDGITQWNDLPYSRSGTNALNAGKGISISNQNVISATLLYDIIEPNE